MGLLATVLRLGAVAVAGAGAGLPCEYWLVEESDAGDYSKLDVAALGFQTNRSVCANADDAAAGKGVSLQQFLAFTRPQIKRSMAARLLPKVRGGAAATGLVILDIESPPSVHPRRYGELNATTLAAVVQATLLRLQVARELLPAAQLALYATPVNSTPAAIAGYRKAGKMGLWDAVDVLIPVLYTGPSMHGQSLAASVSSRLDAALQIRPQSGRALPLVPILSWRMFGAGPHASCAVELRTLHDDLDDIAAWDAAHPGRIAALQWWSGTDNDQDGKPASTCNASNPGATSYLEWLEAAKIVPKRCLPGGVRAKSDDPECPADRLLRNGLCLPPIFPPKGRNLTAIQHDPSRFPPPYLTSPPSAIPVDFGRQLLAIDDYLIQSSNATQSFYQATVRPEPVITPTEAWEGNRSGAPGSGGKIFD